MLDLFKARMAAQGAGQSQAYRRNADMVIDKTFKRDPAYREVYVTHAPSDMFNVKYDAKFFINTRRSLASDEEDYNIQLRQHMSIPVGSYIDIPDNNGELERWLVVLKDSHPQFPTYYVLKCNWTLKWKVGNIIYSILGVLRTQSSYNSGVWTDYVMTSVENQQKFWCPTTPYSQTINYDQRVLMNEPGRPIPIAWRVSKYEPLQPLGVTKLTFTQELASLPEDCGQYGIANFCPHKEHSGLKSELCTHCSLKEPIYIDAGIEMPTEKPVKGRIRYTGNANIRVGGSPKILTAEYWDEINGEFVSYDAYWKITFNNCSIHAHFNGFDWEITPDSSEFGFEVKGGNVRCFIDKKDIFKIKLAADGKSLKLSCDPLYSMVGEYMKIESKDDAGGNAAEINMEVIS